MSEGINELPEAQLLNPNRPIRYRKDGEIDRRAFSSARNGGKSLGAPVIPLDTEKAIACVAAKLSGEKLTGLSKTDRDKVMELVRLAPEEFFSKTSDRLEDIIDIFTKRLLTEAKDIGTRDLVLQSAILIDKLQALRGQKPPTSVHNVQVNINGYSRESALAALTGRKAQAIEVIAEKTPTG